jgi:3-hydroxyisobutyrate dehydrogenase
VAPGSAEALSEIGFVGLGNMGWPMAANLVRAGHHVVVFDTDGEKRERFAREFGAVATGTPGEFSDIEALVTMLPTGGIVRDVLLDDGFVDAVARGTLVIDSSSSEPSGTVALGAILRARGIALVDAPVSGGMVRALDATLAIMLGADDEADAEKAAPILEAMSDRIFRTGKLGSGHAMKALNNFVLAAGFEAAVEALVVARRFGLDESVFARVLNASSGRNVSTETTLPEEVLSGRYRTNFTLALFNKDVRIAADLAAELAVDAPLCRLVQELLADGGETLGWETDYSRIAELWQAKAFSRAHAADSPGHPVR